MFTSVIIIVSGYYHVLVLQFSRETTTEFEYTKSLLLLQWCQHFHLHKGVQVRRLRISLRDSRPDIMYVIGINVHPGRGRYRSTNIVTLSPRFQLHNKSTFQLQFAQRCFATTLVSLSLSSVKITCPALNDKQG